MREIFYLIFFIILASCSNTRTSSKDPTKKVVEYIDQTLKNKHQISNGNIVFLYSLGKELNAKHLTNKDYAKAIINKKSAALALSKDTFNKKYININSKATIDKLRTLCSALNLKIKIPNVQISSLAFDTLVKLHHGALKYLPIILPSCRPIITSHYGMRYHPYQKKKKLHSGIDLASTQKMIFAAAQGVVSNIKRCKHGYGNSITINHSNGFSTLYAHLDKILVNKNQKVLQGELIAIEGRTGAATGVHLHFETIYQNKKINPAIFIKNNM